MKAQTKGSYTTSPKKPHAAGKHPTLKTHKPTIVGRVVTGNATVAGAVPNGNDPDMDGDNDAGQTVDVGV